MAPKAKARAKRAPVPGPDKIEFWPTEKLKPHPSNSKEHPDDQIAMLEASVEEFGQTFPVLVDESGFILAGEGRWRGIKKREQQTTKVIVARGWSPAKKRAYIIMDNKIAERGVWNRMKLGTELGNLQLSGIDMSLLGFDKGELRSLIANAKALGADPDDAPEPPADPISAEGDLWICGDHRVLCGDSTSRAAVDRLFAGAKPHLMVTDPPYGVKYDPNWRNDALKDGAKRAGGKVANDERSDWREAWFLFPGTVAYIWHGGLHGPSVAESLSAAKFNIRAQIIWVKSMQVIGRGDFHWKHEPAFYATQQGAFDDHWRFTEDHEDAAYAVKVGNKADWVGGRKQSTVWEIPLVKNNTGHGTQKPVECMRRPIINNSKGGDAIYDPFLGSGTTLVACQMEGRVCYGLELDPAYVDVILERFIGLTGLVPVHEATGKTFAEMRAARGKKTAAGKRRATA
jgi:DNA modification methylase